MSGCCPLKVAWQGLLMVGRSRVVGVGGKDLSVPGGGPGRVGWLQRGGWAERAWWRRLPHPRTASSGFSPCEAGSKAFTVKGHRSPLAPLDFHGWAAKGKTNAWVCELEGGREEV